VAGTPAQTGALSLIPQTLVFCTINYVIHHRGAPHCISSSSQKVGREDGWEMCKWILGDLC